MEFIYLPAFVKNLKDLSKKYPSLKQDFSVLLDQLKAYPKMGTALGKDCFKIRLAIKSKGRGKSGGLRLITCVKIHHDNLYFLRIYDKADQATITDAELKIALEYLSSIYGK